MLLQKACFLKLCVLKMAPTAVADKNIASVFGYRDSLLRGVKNMHLYDL